MISSTKVNTDCSNTHSITYRLYSHLRTLRIIHCAYCKTGPDKLALFDWINLTILLSPATMAAPALLRRMLRALPGCHLLLRLATVLLLLLGSGCEALSPRDCPAGCSCRFSLINTASLDVNCAHSGLRALHPSLPPARAYRLYLAHNSISTLEPRDYLARTDYLDLSYNQLEGGLDAQLTVQLFSQVRYLYLDNNQLTCLPRNVTQARMRQLHDLALHDNPWSCSCLNGWMSSWLQLQDSQLRKHPLTCRDQLYEVQNTENILDGGGGRPDAIEVTNHPLNRRLFRTLVITLSCLAVVYVCIAVLYLHRHLQQRKLVPARDDYTKHKLKLLAQAQAKMDRQPDVSTI